MKEVSGIITDNLRENDIAARYGGEEFAIIFPNTKLDGAKTICEKIRVAIEDNLFHFNEQNFKITISGGLGEAIIHGEEIEKYNFVNHVDELLYDAKANGKNQIKLSKATVAIS